jgi:hypothetical protein
VIHVARLARPRRRNSGDGWQYSNTREGSTSTAIGGSR